MRKKTALIVFAAVLAGGGALPGHGLGNHPWAFGNGKMPDKSPEARSVDMEQETVTEYLAEKALEPNSGGKVFAACHRFGQSRGRRFIWAYAAEYTKEAGGIELASAHSTPMLLFLSEDGSITGHWSPPDGQGYAADIRNQFPEKFHKSVLAFQSEHKDVLAELERTVRQKAKKQLLCRKADRLLGVGESATLRLDANRTTGYSWHYAIEDTDVIEVIRDVYREEENRRGLLGAGGVRIIEIKALKPGFTRIQFKYYRQWEPEQIKKTREISFKVVAGRERGFDLPPALEQQSRFLSIKDPNIRIYRKARYYPRQFDISQSRIACRTPSGKAAATGTMEKRTINDRLYCIQKSGEGAAGTIYHKYLYATVKKGRMVTVGFTVRSPHCSNFSEPERSECQRQQSAFAPDKIAAHAVAGLKMEPLATPKQKSGQALTQNCPTARRANQKKSHPQL